MVIVRNVICEQDEQPQTAANPLWTGLKFIVFKMMTWLEFDLFGWLHFTEYGHNAKFANHAFSNPSFYAALNRTGKWQ
jgi:hypothetical protein